MCYEPQVDAVARGSKHACYVANHCFLMPSVVARHLRTSILRRTCASDECLRQHIASADPKAKPRVDPRYYFEDETDVEILAEAFKYLRKVSQTSPFGNIVQEEVVLGSSVDLSSDDKVKGKVPRWPSWSAI